MYNYYAIGDEIGTPSTLVSHSERDPKEMMAALVAILERKELLTQADLADILGVSVIDIKRLPF